MYVYHHLVDFRRDSLDGVDIEITAGGALGGCGRLKIAFVAGPSIRPAARSGGCALGPLSTRLSG